VPDSLVGTWSLVDVSKVPAPLDKTETEKEYSSVEKVEDVVIKMS